ncbi:Os05g0108050 [Oryza sativa Japonica Group]|uniref:Os05g0108050 protein n=1 Tax=Oryza sativa subsp. japonica TaxID=39947 RepID=A0A0P0WH18_ORYSJ|nr:hypothetical protein EE612_026588 [Oryza sativa]BAS91892.1 Os05g0108050 [Oryza sativa Japonica Group]
MSTTVPVGPFHLGGSSVLLLARCGCGHSSASCLTCGGSFFFAFITLASPWPGPFFNDLKKSSTFLSNTSPRSSPSFFFFTSASLLLSSSSKKTRPLSAASEEGGEASAGTKALSRDWSGKYFFSRR